MRARYLAAPDHTVVAAVVGVQMLEEPDTTATDGTARPMGARNGARRMAGRTGIRDPRNLG
jgi:hypothetical protein